MEKLRHELEIENEKNKKKRTDQREMYLSLIKENDQKIQEKKKQKEQDKINNKKSLDVLTDLLEKQEKERHLSRAKITHSIKEFDPQLELVRKKEEMLKTYEESKYLKEKYDLENKYIAYFTNILTLNISHFIYFTMALDLKSWMS